MAALGAVAAWSAACGGDSLGEDRPGDDGILDHATVPTTETKEELDDHRCVWNGDLEVGLDDRAYVLVYEADEDCSEDPDASQARKTVWGWAPGEDEARPLVDVTGQEDVRIVFTADGIVLMGQVGGIGDGSRESLVRLDPDTLDVLARVEGETWYWGSRTSPSRRWVAVADNEAPDHPLHVLDPRTLTAVPIATDASWLEAQWVHGSDRLVGVILGADSGQAHLRTWSLEGTERFVDGVMPVPELDVDLGDVMPSLFFGYSWIAIAPDDRRAAVPMVDLDDGSDVLVLADLESGAVTTLPDVAGPVAWTRDGAELIGWQENALVVVDPESGDRREIAVTAALPEFFLSRDGDQVLVADALDPTVPLQVVDISTGRVWTLELAGGLRDFTYRDGTGELWLAEEGELSRIDLRPAGVETMSLPFAPKRLNRMPGADLLVLDHGNEHALSLFDPDTAEVVATVELGGGGRGEPLDLASTPPQRPRLPGFDRDETAHGGFRDPVRPARFDAGR